MACTQSTLDGLIVRFIFPVLCSTAVRMYHTEGQIYIGSICIYGNRGKDTLEGFGELFHCLVLTEREERGLPCDDLAVYFWH